ARQQQLMTKQALGSINYQELIAEHTKSLDATVKMFEKFQQNRKDPGAEMNAEQFRQQLIDNMDKMVQEMKAKQQLAEEGTLPMHSNEQIMAMGYSAELGLLAVGTSHGLRVYEWQSIAQSQEEYPRPRWAVSVEGPASIVRETVTTNNYVNALAFDAERNWLLYGGLAGNIFMLDLNCGVSQPLLRLPGSLAVLGLSFTSDRKHLIVVTRPGPLSRALQNQLFELAIWDYQRICQDVNRPGLRIFNA
ncbi:MAG TPA: hypothetical protein PLX97_03405, partial [Gemmatales bacterium]|nr:hypothetical protein [Gemmatales bacterium]